MHRDVLEADARQLVRECGTRDPFQIARLTGAYVRFKELGSLKGMYLVLNGFRFLVINPNLSAALQRMVCAHELGHDRFHREEAQDHALHEFAAATGSDRTEYEANVFAAALLIDDDAMLYSEAGSPEALAAELGVDTNLLALRMQSLRARGIPCPEWSYRSDFLKSR